MRLRTETVAMSVQKNTWELKLTRQTKTDSTQLTRRKSKGSYSGSGPPVNRLVPGIGVLYELLVEGATGGDRVVVRVRTDREEACRI